MKRASHWKIENDAVVKCSPFDTHLHTVEAYTKAQATALFITRAERMLKNPPRAYVWNGAYMLVSHNGSNFVAESGVFPIAPKRECAALCTAHHATLAAAVCDATFAYYASEDYQRIRANQLASLKPEAIASAQESQRLSDLAS